MSPYLTTADVAERLRFTDTKYPLINAWKWIKRNNVRQLRRGRRVLVFRADVDAALKGGRHD